jgi:nitrogen fixation/metabolism regulation signal transduction histidine kinase
MFNDQIIKEQDEQLTEIQNSVKRIKENSKIIHETINNQNIYIKEIDEGIDKNKENMNYAMNKIGTLLKTKNKGQIKCFLTLICISLFLIFLLII